MEFWYPTYFNQNWYPNTFLVHRPAQIARSIRNNREWNSIAAVGCNLTCLAMILGIDPAHLAGALARSKRFFAPDPRAPAVRLTKHRGAMVWDQNRPNENLKKAMVKGLWHPERGKINVTIRFIQSHFPEDLAETEAAIAGIRSRGCHAIWGPATHANLVAGRSSTGYFLWNPGVARSRIAVTAKGRLRLSASFPKRTFTEVYEYEVKIAAA
jgi:hypothetical protein